MPKISVYVTKDLKARMDAVEGVNWSPLACVAFEEKLAELITERGARTVKDVIARLKASKARDEAKEKVRGRGYGREWASNIAGAAELQRLEEHITKLGGGTRSWESFMESGDSDAFGADHWIAEAIRGDETDRQDSDMFWENVIGEHDPRDRDRADFLIGFVEGALGVWDQVKDEL